MGSRHDRVDTHRRTRSLGSEIFERAFQSSEKRVGRTLAATISNVDHTSPSVKVGLKRIELASPVDLVDGHENVSGYFLSLMTMSMSAPLIFPAPSLEVVAPDIGTPSMLMAIDPPDSLSLPLV